MRLHKVTLKMTTCNPDPDYKMAVQFLGKGRQSDHLLLAYLFQQPEIIRDAAKDYRF